MTKETKLETKLEKEREYWTGLKKLNNMSVDEVARRLDVSGIVAHWLLSWIHSPLQDELKKKGKEV